MIEKPEVKQEKEIGYEEKKFKLHCNLQTAYDEQSFDTVLSIILQMEHLALSEGRRQGLEKAKEIAKQCDNKYGQEALYNFFIAIDNELTKPAEAE